MDYHVLSQDDKRKTIQVVFHIPIPAAGTNEANVSWRDAVVQEQGGADNIASVLPNITTAEESDMKAGALIEKQTSVRFSSTSLTTAQRKAQIEAEFNKQKADLVAEKQITLEFMGYSADAA